MSLCLVLKIPIPINSKVLIKPLYLSFRDFLVDDEKEEEYLLFQVNKKKRYTKLTHLYLRVLNEGKYLTKDIYKLGKLGLIRDKITQENLDKHLLVHVKYTYLYQVHYQKEGSKEKSNAKKGNIKDGPLEEDNIKIDNKSLVSLFLRDYFYWTLIITCQLT